MAYNLKDKLVIGISSRSLFDLEKENEIYENEGLDAYKKFQRDHENELLKPGTAFPLVKALLRLNELCEDRLVEIVIMSRNTPDTGLRAFNSVNKYELDITRAAFSGGESLVPYLDAFEVDLFLSKSEIDVQKAVDAGTAAAVIYAPPVENNSTDEGVIRIAFDGDAVLFSEESEMIYQTQGLEAFQAHEASNSETNLAEGPFAKLLKTLSFVQQQYTAEERPVRIAIVTARSCPAHTRVIKTLRAWNVDVDDAFFLGGVSKDKVLKAFGAHIFFDDQDLHVKSASKLVPSARVPRKGNA
ncbi:MAG: 5'-nucleotidase [Lentisphaeria bacterium]|nr:5'-nucleotidase [Lentisphaeria bacterium]